MSTINGLPNSLRWAAMETLFAALQAAPALAGVIVVRNPRSPAPLQQGAHTVFLKDQTETLYASSGQSEGRQHQFILGAVARNDAADGDADALHEAAVDVLRNTLDTALKGRVRSLAEGATQFSVANLEVDGALVLSTWDMKYVKTWRMAQ